MFISAGKGDGFPSHAASDASPLQFWLLQLFPTYSSPLDCYRFKPDPREKIAISSGHSSKLADISHTLTLVGQVADQRFHPIDT